MQLICAGPSENLPAPHDLHASSRWPSWSCHSPAGQSPHAVGLPAALCDPATQAAVRFLPALHDPHEAVAPLEVAPHVADVYVGVAAPVLPTAHGLHVCAPPSSHWLPVHSEQGS